MNKINKKKMEKAKIRYYRKLKNKLNYKKYKCYPVKRSKIFNAEQKISEWNYILLGTSEFRTFYLHMVKTHNVLLFIAF